MSAFSRFIVMAIVSRYSESVFMTRPVGELLFGGFYHELISTFSGITGETYMPNNTFGFLYGVSPLKAFQQPNLCYKCFMSAEKRYVPRLSRSQSRSKKPSSFWTHPKVERSQRNGVVESSQF